VHIVVAVLGKQRMSAASQYCPLGHEPVTAPQPGVGVHGAPGAMHVSAAQTSPAAQQRAGAPHRALPPHSSWHVPSTQVSPAGQGRLAEQRWLSPMSDPSLAAASGITVESGCDGASATASIERMSDGATRSSPPSMGVAGAEQAATMSAPSASGERLWVRRFISVGWYRDQGV
jgi:hypothetical protein